MSVPCWGIVNAVKQALINMEDDSLEVVVISTDGETRRKVNNFYKYAS